MKRGAAKHAVKKRAPKRESLTEAYEVRAFRDEEEEIRDVDMGALDILHADAGDFEIIKDVIKGHGEQALLPDDCEFGDNDLCYVET